MKLSSLFSFLLIACCLGSITSQPSNYVPQCNQPDVYYLPDVVNCSQRYFQCSSGQVQLRFCTDGWAFDNVTGKCIDIDLLPACKKAPQGIISLTSVDYNFDCSGRPNGNYTNNQSLCSPIHEVICTNEVAKILFCPATTRYDPKRDVCTYPKYISECGGVEMLMTGSYLRGTTIPQRRFTHFLTTQILHADDHGMIFSCDTRVGNFPNPDKPCSRMFVVCTPDGMKGAMCPSGAVFDANNDRCEFPEFVEDCGGHSPTPTSTTSRPTTTKSPMKCEGLDPGNYPNPLNPCSNNFYVCTGLPYGIVQSCPGKTVFDPILNRCGYTHEVPECGGTTTTAPSTASTASTPSRASFDCATRVIGDYPDPQNRCSQHYFVCNGTGRTTVIRCPGNFYYDQEFHTCSKVSEIPECGGTRTTTTPPSNDLPASTYAPFSCADRPDDKYAAPGVSCPNFYFECAKNLSIIKRCETGLRYNEKLGECRPPQEVVGCEEFRGNPGPFCGGKSTSGFYEKPNSCAKFYFCVGGQEFELNCPPGSAYNNLTNQCDVLGFIQPPCGTAKPLAEFNCSELLDGKYGAFQDCGCYYICSNGSATKHRCPDGLAYNMAMQNCTLPTLVEGCHMPMRKDIQACVDQPDGIYAHPSNCRRSLLCAHNKTFMFYCWEDSYPYFNPILKRCVAATDFCSSKTPI